MGNIVGKALTLEEFKKGIRLMHLYLHSYSNKAGRHLEGIEVDAIVSAARHSDDDGDGLVGDAVVVDVIGERPGAVR